MKVMGHLILPKTRCTTTNAIFLLFKSDGILRLFGEVKHIGERISHLCLPRQGNPREPCDGRFLSGEIRVDRCKRMLVGNIILFLPSSPHRENDLCRKTLRNNKQTNKKTKYRFFPELQVW